MFMLCHRFPRGAISFTMRTRHFFLGVLVVFSPTLMAACPDFMTAADYAAGSKPAGVAAGDFNRDGRLDLAVANQDSNNVSILLGNGSGTFAAPVNYATGAG